MSTWSLFFFLFVSVSTSPPPHPPPQAKLGITVITLSQNSQIRYLAYFSFKVAEIEI